MAIRSKPVKCLLVGVAALFVIVALITLVTVLIFDRLFLTIMYKQLALVPGSAAFAGWLKPSVPVYFAVYLFNVTNAEDVLQGHAPHLEEVGPYVYLENRERYDVEFPKESVPRTVRFKHRIFYHYVPEMSIRSPSIGKITIPNLALAGLIDSGSWLYFGQEAFVTLSPEEAMWRFYPGVLPVNAGLFAKYNGTNPREYVINTGADDISKIGSIISVNGEKQLTVWDHEEANMINGSDGSSAPPGLKVGSTVNFYVADICRSVVSYAVAKTTATNRKDIELLVFSGTPPDPRDPANDWRERMFCKSGYGCPPKGLLSLHACLAAAGPAVPMFLSQPYFLGADPRIPAAFDRFPDPIPERHSTWVHIEPTTGFVLEAFKRIQFNLYMSNAKRIEEYKDMAGPYYFPVGWVEESAVADRASLDMLYEKLFLPRKTIPFILSIVGAVSTVISILLIVLLITCTRRRSSLARAKRNGALSSPTSPIGGSTKDVDGSRFGGSDLAQVVQPNQSPKPIRTNTQVPEANPLLNITETAEINYA